MNFTRNNVSQILNDSDYPELRALLCQWINYKSVNQRRLKMVHDLELTDGTILIGYYPNANGWHKMLQNSEGPDLLEDSQVRSIRINPAPFHLKVRELTPELITSHAVKLRQVVMDGARRGRVTYVSTIDTDHPHIGVRWDTPPLEVTSLNGELSEFTLTNMEDVDGSEYQAEVHRINCGVLVVLDSSSESCEADDDYALAP